MLNKLVLRVVLTLSLAFTGMANATLITQDIISDSEGVIGHISINLDTTEDVGFGLGQVRVWEEFEFFGIDMLAPAPMDNEMGEQFFAEYDMMDLYAGIQTIAFDLDDVYGWYLWNGFVEAGFGGYIDIFDNWVQPDPAFVLFMDDLSFGEAAVVPEPSALILLLTGLVAFAARRKVSK
ncbi:MAG: PEP-CTERM sorting domain-containing protein [Colwellia sp.]|nr:PEP-CTERM sorting domain-containing protein [Colwellia sp.]MCW8863949.1 PEP-CTERM sorting domain-containing protein [Colwellia sp.]MCW9080112.1 PEP-CTERM sorting domain-containing protein [Colwellia sp.]